MQTIIKQRCKYLAKQAAKEFIKLSGSIILACLLICFTVNHILELFGFIYIGKVHIRLFIICFIIGFFIGLLFAKSVKEKLSIFYLCFKTARYIEYLSDSYFYQDKEKIFKLELAIGQLENKFEKAKWVA